EHDRDRQRDRASEEHRRDDRDRQRVDREPREPAADRNGKTASHGSAIGCSRSHLQRCEDLCAVFTRSSSGAILDRSSNMHVLIAEDDRVTGEILARTLRRWDYETTLVTNGREAWQFLSTTTAPTVAILDWMMPEADGPDICRRVRAELPDAHMYLLLVTA